MVSYVRIADNAFHESMCLAVWTIAFIAHACWPSNGLTPDQHATKAGDFADAIERRLRERAGKAMAE